MFEMLHHWFGFVPVLPNFADFFVQKKKIVIIMKRAGENNSDSAKSKQARSTSGAVEKPNVQLDSIGRH